MFKKVAILAGASGLWVNLASAQNPMNSINEPDYAPGGEPTGQTLFFVLAIYVFFFWLIFKGPLRTWSDDNKGASAMLLMFGPIACGFVYTLWFAS